MDQWPHICRLPDGAIDYDFYRRKIRAQRTMSVREFSKPKRRRGLEANPTFLTRLLTAWKA